MRRGRCAVWSTTKLSQNPFSWTKPRAQRTTRHNGDGAVSPVGHQRLDDLTMREVGDVAARRSRSTVPATSSRRSNPAATGRAPRRFSTTEVTTHSTRGRTVRSRGDREDFVTPGQHDRPGPDTARQQLHPTQPPAKYGASHRAIIATTAAATTGFSAPPHRARTKDQERLLRHRVPSRHRAPVLQGQPNHRGRALAAGTAPTGRYRR